MSKSLCSVEAASLPKSFPRPFKNGAGYDEMRAALTQY
jgi:hypothetical protein